MIRREKNITKHSRRLEKSSNESVWNEKLVEQKKKMTTNWCNGSKNMDFFFSQYKPHSWCRQRAIPAWCEPINVQRTSWYQYHQIRDFKSQIVCRYMHKAVRNRCLSLSVKLKMTIKYYIIAVFSLSRVSCTVLCIGYVNEIVHVVWRLGVFI